MSAIRKTNSFGGRATESTHLVERLVRPCSTSSLCTWPGWCIGRLCRRIYFVCSWNDTGGMRARGRRGIIVVLLLVVVVGLLLALDGLEERRGEKRREGGEHPSLSRVEDERSSSSWILLSRKR